jgi:hypothetical protein
MNLMMYDMAEAGVTQLAGEEECSAAKQESFRPGFSPDAIASAPTLQCKGYVY